MASVSLASVDPPKLEYCSCPLCGSADRSRAAYRFSPFDVVRCRSCRLWYLHPRATESAAMEFYVDADYYDARGSEGYADYHSQEPALRRTFQRFLKALEERDMTGGTLLEIGCAYGYLLDEARDYFTRRAGLDMSAEAVSRARRVADPVRLGGLEQIPPDEAYSCIVAIQVIEHVYEPLEFVRRAAARLEPGGWLVLATPDMGSPWRRLMRRRWPSFKIPEHVTYYDFRSLGRLLGEAGLDELRRIPYPHAFPLGLVAAKLGLRVPASLERRSLWIPGTTLTLAARKI